MTLREVLYKCREEFCWHGNTGKHLSADTYAALVDMIDKALDSSPLDSSPSEADQRCKHVTCGDVNRMLSFERDAARLRTALQQSMTALDDWLNTYAADQCDADRVEEARQRIMQYGTIGYIAHVQAANRAAMSARSETEEG